MYRRFTFGECALLFLIFNHHLNSYIYIFFHSPSKQGDVIASHTSPTHVTEETDAMEVNTKHVTVEHSDLQSATQGKI